ncbi:hypothetical protein EV179_005047 [Coemansia sp. RSA 487]|nr:hypothetical protein LPJ74_005181 [Coemansia sp. RSA 1843]KAJ2087156.1 hypothetical protein IW138_005143 [Coemansia sp. RSA 986]KAJ2212003.1 hypothetical protein EV179_005047 [Coemansia sp. RSA 487]
MNDNSAMDDSLISSVVLVNGDVSPVSEKNHDEKPPTSAAKPARTESSSSIDEKKEYKSVSKLRGNHIVILALRRMLKGPAPTLDHIIRFLSSGSGHDKFWMVTQYFTKIVVWLFAKRGQKSASERVRTLSNLVADYRIMIRLTGLVPMAQYVRYAEQFPAPSQLLQWLDRIMNLSLCVYYPLEHIYWLGAHQVLPFSDKVVDFSGYWSCRFWAAWVGLQFAHLGEEYRLIKGRKQKIYTQDKMDAAKMQEELDSVDAAMKSWKIQLLINACYFPLTLHWSIRGSTFPDVAVGAFGTVAALAQTYNVWKETA